MYERARVEDWPSEVVLSITITILTKLNTL